MRFTLAPRYIALFLVPAALIAFSSSVSLLADHPDEHLELPFDADHDPQSHSHIETYEGPGWYAGQGGSPEVSFSAQGVELLSWITVPQFGSQNTSASVVEGYVSPSGREYAVVGLSCGAGFVEVTDPRNPVIRGFIPGFCSLWRDIRIYQNYAYVGSEAGSFGVQVIDMSAIDSGVVTLVNTITAPSLHSARTHTLEINQASGYLYRCGGGNAKGVKVYDLVNPASPNYIGTIFNTLYVHECQVVTYTDGPYSGKEIAFLYNDEGSGGGSPSLGIVDVTNKASPIVLSNYLYPNGQFSHQGWLSADRHYVYLDDELDEGGFGIPTTTHVIDVSDLTNPFQTATFTNNIPTIDHNQYVKGLRLFQSNYQSGLRIWRLENPVAPTEVAFFDTYPEGQAGAFNSLWDNDPFLPSGIILGSDIEKGLFVWCADPKGDMDHDGLVGLSDVDFFVGNLLSNLPVVGVCGGGDMNGDGVMDGLDLPGFVSALLGP